MDEHVRPASVWLDEAIPLCRVEPLHCPHSHFEISLKQKERLDKRDSSVDLAAIQRQKAVAELSQRRLSVIIVNTLLPSLALRHVASRCRLRFLSDQRRTEIGSRHQQKNILTSALARQTSCSARCNMSCPNPLLSKPTRTLDEVLLLLARAMSP